MKQMIDFWHVIDDINKHMKRIGWTKETGANYLKTNYGKHSRFLLNDQQLLEFRAYLANYQVDKQPTVSRIKAPKMKLRSLRLKK